jgi:basic amino acid/polyamine antiporter, APA family
VTATSTERTTPAAGAEGGELRRGISRRMLLFFIVGDILGAGIYALVGEVGGRVGGAIWAAFALALLLAVFTAFAYAELVTKYPQAAGAALYVNKAFRRPFFTFVVAFAVMCSGLASAATLARAFGGDYLSEFVSLPTALVGVGFIAVMSLVNLRGIKESVGLNVGLTLIELTGLLLVVLIGAAALFDGAGEPSRALEFADDEAVPLAIMGGAGLAFFALIGFEDSVNVAEETQEPRRNYPFALFGGLLIAGVIYLLVTVIASMVVPTDTLADSDGPLLEVVQVGPLAMSTKVFSAIALFALANGALINLIMASRLVYGMARERILPGAFGRVHATRRTPWVAIAFTALIAAGLVLTGDLEDLADTTVLLLLLVFAVVNVAVLVLRRDRIDADHFRAPTVLPVIGAAVSLALLTTKDGEVFLRAGALLALGVVLWLVTWYAHGRHQPSMDTGVLQAVSRPDDERGSR